MNDEEINAMLDHLKSMHLTYRMITKACGFARTKIINYRVPGGKSAKRCGFSEDEKSRLVDFYKRACELVDVRPVALADKPKKS